MTTTYFMLSVIGVVLTLNLFKPVTKLPQLTIPSFAFGWLIGELVYFVFAVQLLGTLLFVAAGAVTGFMGALGLLLSVLSWLGMALYWHRAALTGREFDDALRATLGDGYQRLIKPELLEQIPTDPEFARLLKPFSPHLPEVEQLKNLVFHEEDGVKLLLDIYRKRSLSENAPVLLQIHGGGWTEKMGDKDGQALPLMNQLAAMGWVCVAVSYRLSPKFAFPAHIIDCKRGLAWTKKHISEYGGNPDFIVATGGSAGGHLSSLLALTANAPDFQPGFEHVDTSIQACVPFYGVFDFSDEYMLHSHVGVRDYVAKTVLQLPLSEADAFRKASPMHRVHQDAPPFLIIHGTCDSLTAFEEGQHFAAALRKASNQPVVFAPIHLGQHAFDIFRSTRSEYAMYGVMRFVNYVYSRYLQQPETGTANSEAQISKRDRDAA